MGSRMKTLFLVVPLLSQLLPATSKTAKHLLLETVDKKNDSVVASPADNAIKVGSDYAGCYPICHLMEPHGSDSTRKDPICAGNSRHGAPCTTGRNMKYAGRAAPSLLEMRDGNPNTDRFSLDNDKDTHKENIIFSSDFYWLKIWKRGNMIFSFVLNY